MQCSFDIGVLLMEYLRLNIIVEVNLLQSCYKGLYILGIQYYKMYDMGGGMINIQSVEPLLLFDKSFVKILSPL